MNYKIFIIFLILVLSIYSCNKTEFCSELWFNFFDTTEIKIITTKYLDDVMHYQNTLAEEGDNNTILLVEDSSLFLKNGVDTITFKELIQFRYANYDLLCKNEKILEGSSLLHSLDDNDTVSIFHAITKPFSFDDGIKKYFALAINCGYYFYEGLHSGSDASYYIYNQKNTEQQSCIRKNSYITSLDVHDTIYSLNGNTFNAVYYYGEIDTSFHIDENNNPNFKNFSLVYIQKFGFVKLIFNDNIYEKII